MMIINILKKKIKKPRSDKKERKKGREKRS